MYNFTVFICDDESPQLESLSKLIANRFPGVKIETFFSPTSLINQLYLTNDNVDVLFLDHHFKGTITGVQALPAIRKVCPDLPIIILTGEVDYKPFAGLADYNVKFLNKPSTEAQIIFAIEGSLAGTKKYIELEEDNKKLTLELADARKMLLKTIDVNISDETIDLDISWNIYKDQIDRVIENYSNNVDLSTIQGRIKQKYPALPQNELVHLATGEYLRQNLKEDRIDYSPILIAYGKSLESILFRLLKKLDVKNLEQNHSLMSLINLCTMKNTLFKNQLIMKSMMVQFLRFRNKAAHKEGVSIDDLCEAKSLLFNLDRPTGSILDELNYVFGRI